MPHNTPRRRLASRETHPAIMADPIIIFKDEAIELHLLQAALQEIRASPKKPPQSNQAWVEREWGEECGKVLGVCTQILDKVGLDAIERVTNRAADPSHVQVADDSDLAAIVKPKLKRAQTFRTVWEILPGTSSVNRYITVPADYLLIVPLALEGLPRWGRKHSSNDLVPLHWKMRSVLFIKGGTELVCSSDGGGVFMMLGVKHEAK